MISNTNSQIKRLFRFINGVDQVQKHKISKRTIKHLWTFLWDNFKQLDGKELKCNGKEH